MISSAIQFAADALFVPWLVALLFGTGIYLTIRLRFVQVIRFGEAIRSCAVLRDDRGGGVLSPFQSFMTALAATVGTGNIAGVATAIVSGGPGALFWMWAYGFVAMAIKASEAVLGVLYRDAHGVTLVAGPMIILRDGLGAPRLGQAYALLAGVAALTTTPFTQSSSIAVVLESEAGLPPWTTGLAVALLTALVVLGGINSIGRTMERLAPLKVGLYLGGGLIVIVTFLERLPEILALVFREAFSLEAAGGGGFGMLVAMRYGVARGVYANEAGYGTAAVAYGTAASRSPRDQGLNAILETFLVSFGTTTVSALAVLLTGAWLSGRTSSAAVALAIEQALPGLGGAVVAVSALLFGYGTLIGWAYYGEQCFVSLFGRRIARPYRWIYCALIPFGAVGKVDLVWAWGDLMNALQIFPNLIGVLALSAVVARVLHDRSKPPGK